MWRGLVILLMPAIGVGLWPGPGRAQAPETAPPPAEAAAWPCLPPLPPYVPPVDEQLRPDDPLLVPPGQTHGWFFDAGLGIVQPHIKNRLTSDIPLVADAPLHLPTAPLDWTAMPTLEAGYRLANGAGALRAAYTFLNTSGSETLPGFDAAGTGTLRSRLSLNRIDLNYATSEFLLNPPPELWRTEYFSVGLSAADVFFDSQARGGQILYQRTSNDFLGIGPSVMYGWLKTLPHCPVSLYGRIDATGLFGNTRQHFVDTESLGGVVVSRSAAVGPQANGVGVLGAEAGLSTTPGWFARPLLFRLGYQWQRWWFVGNTDLSSAELTIQGIFLRAEFAY